MEQNPGLARWLQERYPFLEEPGVELLRSYTNDVHRVTTAGQGFVLKIYGKGWRSAEEIRYEIDLLLHLSSQGVPIASPVPGRDGQILQLRAASSFEQHAVLFEYAAGEKPRMPFSNALYYRFGEAIARMHEASTSFASRFRRQPVDLAYLIDRPLLRILPFCENGSPHASDLKIFANRIKKKITQLSSHGLDWGPIHGDATLDNLHVTTEGVVILYDFDSGGPGWRASDLQGWAISEPSYQEKYAAFVNGYSAVRTLRDQDVEASWYLTLAWDIWAMQVDLERRVLPAGMDAVQEYLYSAFEHLRWRQSFLP